MAPAKAQYLGGGDPWPWDIGGFTMGNHPVTLGDCGIFFSEETCGCNMMNWEMYGNVMQIWNINHYQSCGDGGKHGG